MQRSDKGREQDALSLSGLRSVWYDHVPFLNKFGHPGLVEYLLSHYRG